LTPAAQGHSVLGNVGAEEQTPVRRGGTLSVGRCPPGGRDRV